MIPLFSSIAFHAYALGAALYLICLVRPKEALAWVARAAIAVGLLLHGAALCSQFAGQGGAPLGLAQGFSTVGFLLLAIFLFVDLRYRLPALGAFLSPLALGVLFPGLLLAGGHQVLPDAVRRPLLPIHIAIALLGIAALAVAAGVAGIYLLMEREVKGKKFGLLFSRLPSLQILDDLNRRLVLAGFVALSVTLLTGVFFTGTQMFWQWGSREIATLAAWALFGGLLNARIFAGWQGRRVALLTVAGFCVVMVSFFSSYDLTRLGGLR
jgi:ABC-type uncharacterized transport system permease subunit